MYVYALLFIHFIIICQFALLLYVIIVNVENVGSFSIVFIRVLFLVSLNNFDRLANLMTKKYIKDDN